MKRLIKYIQYFLLTLLALFWVVGFFLFAKPLWHRLVTYPRYQKEVEAFQFRKKACPAISELKTYRGVLHLHSYWSHDSKGTIYDLVSAAKLRDINFIFLTDHPHGNIDSFPRGYKGMYDGILVEPGSEKAEFDVWPMDSTVLDWRLHKDTIAKQVMSQGGMLFYAHTENPHNWDSEWFQGMEIYNFHSNVLGIKSKLPILTDFLINGSKYRAWAYRSIFERQTAILARWDSLNTYRKIVGFSAVDEHENVNFRARYLRDGRVQWMGINTKPIDTVRVTFWNRWMFHQPDSSGWIFKWMVINTYETSFNNSVNYLFADSLTLGSISSHLKLGHHFTAFRFLADATGFCYYGEGSDGKPVGIMGDSIAIGSLKRLVAVSPYPGRFTLIRNGQVVDRSPDDQYNYSYQQPLQHGAYRLEVEVKPGSDWQPWIYTNPLYLY